MPRRACPVFFTAHALPELLTIIKETLGYFKNGNVSSLGLVNKGNSSWQNLNFTYTYDDQSRLMSNVCSNANYTENYQYDPDGNISSKNRTGQNISYFYTNGTNKLDYVLFNGYTKNYSYDPRGNAVSDNLNLTSLYNYDYRNLPLQVENEDMVDYYYDDAGNRIGKNGSSGMEFYLRDNNGRELAIYQLANTGHQLKMVNLYGNGLMGRVDVNWEEVETTNERGEPEIGWERYDSRNYYIKDHLGSIRVVVDQDGEIVSAQDYYPPTQSHRRQLKGCEN